MSVWQRQEFQVLPRSLGERAGVRDFSDDVRALRRRLTEAEGYLDLEGRRKRLAELEAEGSRPDLGGGAPGSTGSSRATATRWRASTPAFPTSRRSSSSPSRKTTSPWRPSSRGSS